MALFRFDRSLFVHLHWGIFLCMVLLTLIGVAAIAGSELPGQPHAPRQMIWLALGIFAFLITVSIEPVWIRFLAPVAYALLLIALVGLLIRAETIKGSASWYRLGPMRLQPSEFMKVAVILILAHLATRRPDSWRSLPHLFVPILLVAAPVLLIFKQPDLGTAAVFMPPLAVVLFLGGARVRHLILLALLPICGIGLLYPHLKPYQQARIRSFVNPTADIRGDGWNIYQAKITLGSGQMWGHVIRGDDEDDLDSIDQAPGLSRAQLDFLPEAHTDFIFASLGEQFGFVGCAAVLILYALMAAFAISIAVQARTFHGSLVVLGLLAVILTHVFFNLGMSLGLLPVTGLPLPFLSYGGSSMLTNFIIGGLICNVGARRFEFETTRQ